MTELGRPGYSRRRFISIVAGGAAAMAGPAVSAAENRYRWRGRALGAAVEIILHAKNEHRARELAMAGLDEIERLEKQFSLYRDDSALVHLNAAGRLDMPSHDMLALLDHARYFGKLSDGAFDVSMQPLWRLHAEHFAQPDADPNGPDPKALARARRAVDYRAIDVRPEAVVLGKPGMALSFNGIAQGYITDAVTRLFRAGGVRDVLVNLGEFRALGTNRQAARPWQVGVNPASKSSTQMPMFELTNRALATSAPSGTVFEASGRHHHLFDPRTGTSADTTSSVTVMAESAVEADALSTALSVVTPRRQAAIVAATKKVEALVTSLHGVSVRLKS